MKGEISLYIAALKTIYSCFVKSKRIKILLIYLINEAISVHVTWCKHV